MRTSQHDNSENYLTNDCGTCNPLGWWEVMVMCIGGPDSIGKTVRAARETKDWGPATLAKHAGIPAAMVHAIEAGREDIPLTTIRRCMVALNLYLAWEVLPKEAIEGDSK